ncbi:MBL fold metallo-hydrolase [Rummeliibacillus pycnus]|uniref:MBL fold metallo-hydrolase n=1 Tax=Rummeliibacillus pycnus TaxID=101070 RepID=UPI0037C69F7A
MILKKTVVTEELNGVQSINGTLSFQGVTLNVYSYVTDGILIDTGGKRLQKQFAPFLLEQDYDQAWITHHHEDHTGGAAFIMETRNVPVFIHKMSIEEAKGKPDYPLYRQLFWGRRKAFEALPFSDTMKSRSATWDIIETPGHSNDHLAFLNRQTGQLFTGDLYVTPKTKVIMQDESIPTIINSLERVLTYDFEDVFCQHAGLVQNGRKLLIQKKEYLEDIQHQVLKLHDEGYSNKEIQQKLFPRKYPITTFSSGDWDSLHIIESVLVNAN